MAQLHKRYNLVHNEKGFTLTEVLIVLAVIGIMAGFLVPNIISKFDQAKVDSTKINMRTLGTILDDYKRVCNLYPTTDQTLESLVTAPTGGRVCKNYPPEGFVKDKKMLVDAWDNPFMYESDGRKYLLKSYGDDLAEGGEGRAQDITSDNL